MIGNKEAFQLNTNECYIVNKFEHVQGSLFMVISKLNMFEHVVGLGSLYGEGRHTEGGEVPV